ncbi:hypothetical protein Zmor_002150 [Zophobas morio]|uniref:Uncharacterized protein n=1 Tax=Zophobas morio TaxID=2755281 RepID=A0AA38J949_9CUCU|nr:hypothetical protein Zmor_002150 [Zophobas morio]
MSGVWGSWLWLFSLHDGDSVLFYRQAHAIQHPSMTKKRITRKQAVTVANSWLEIPAIEPSRERDLIPTPPLISILGLHPFVQMVRPPARQGIAHSASAT